MCFAHPFMRNAAADCRVTSYPDIRKSADSLPLRSSFGSRLSTAVCGVSKFSSTLSLAQFDVDTPIILRQYALVQFSSQVFLDNCLGRGLQSHTADGPAHAHAWMVAVASSIMCNHQAAALLRTTSYNGADARIRAKHGTSPHASSN